ncbi:hypothetical protein [Sphaerisporangium siamense]|uniref:Uncharacterized protein n=1 Tax=Sphaerisporangium siamense TaxID=795645 RepID=A0A7W7GBS3_9ACTN|nr:hypothetical protein [Sphaerisporangium siamense]MBB4705338.1 hypothetical protein [Sphaerisporangium siamense]
MTEHTTDVIEHTPQAAEHMPQVAKRTNQVTGRMSQVVEHAIQTAEQTALGKAHQAHVVKRTTFAVPYTTWVASRMGLVARHAYESDRSHGRQSRDGRDHARPHRAVQQHK